jgi:hypothetical protein
MCEVVKLQKRNGTHCQPTHPSLGLQPCIIIEAHFLGFSCTPDQLV